jgi:hypothetical protein
MLRHCGNKIKKYDKKQADAKQKGLEMKTWTKTFWGGNEELLG